MNRFFVCAAYWIVARRHHSGQWSKGYAKLSQLSRIGYSPGLASWANKRASEERRAAPRFSAADAAKSDCIGDRMPWNSSRREVIERRDMMQELTDSIVTELERGVVPWKRDWDP